MASEPGAGTEPKKSQMNTKNFLVQWHGLPREGVECLLLEMFQSCLAQPCPLGWQGTGSWDQVSPHGPFQPGPFCDSGQSVPEPLPDGDEDEAGPSPGGPTLAVTATCIVSLGVFSNSLNNLQDFNRH